MSEANRDAVLRCEMTDAALTADFTRCIPVATAQELAVALLSMGPVEAAIAAKVDVLFLNRAVGLGVLAPAVAADVDHLVAVYRAAKAPRFMVQIAPGAAPGDLTSWLEERGFYHHNNWMKLLRGAEPVASADTDLRVECITPAHAAAFAGVVAGAFSFPSVMHPWIAATVGRPRWTHCLAFDGDTPVAAGALYVDGETGWLGFGATLPDARRRGAQSAIIAARVREGLAQGCTWFVTETAEDTPDKPNPSTHNLLRQGFAHAYLRPNWVLKLA